MLPRKSQGEGKKGEKRKNREIKVTNEKNRKNREIKGTNKNGRRRFLKVADA